MDPRTAYQIVHLMEGVIIRGTGMNLASLGRPLAGKTGTTSGPRDVWFVGGTQDLVAGLYMGYDTPRNLGGYAQGGTMAAPVWRQFGEAVLQDAPKLPFVVPSGIRMVRIDRRTGKRVYGAWPAAEERRSPTIWEAYKPESEPRRAVGNIDPFAIDPRRRVRSDAEFLRNEGGIY
jgi:penicillin-binding protein 1A